MSLLSLQQAAKKLGISTRTLLRWDEDGTFPAAHEEVSKTRVYDEEIVEVYARYMAVRKTHREHLNKLGAIQASLSKFIVTKPLNPFEPTQVHKYEEMKKAYDAKHEWDKQYKKIEEEENKFYDFLKRIRSKKN